MPDAFFSYSRRDGDFVRQLAGALTQRGKKVWVDVDGIRDTERFPEALRRAIESSDAFVFVISPDSVSSEFCEQEVAHAAGLNKRIVPLALRPVPDKELPEEIRFRNWIPVDGEAPFEAGVERLVSALETDLEWERQHTRVTVKALEWDGSGRDKSFLLRGADLKAAERWLAAGADKDPGPTSLEQEYLLAARQSATRRQRALVGGSLAVALVAIGLLVFALISRSAAIGQALTSDAERVGGQAINEKDVDRALLLAVAAVKLQNRPETRSDLLAVLQKYPAVIRFVRPFGDLVTAVQVSPDGRLLAVSDESGVVRFINLATWRRLGDEVKLGDPVAPLAMSFSRDGRTLMVVTVGADRSTLEAIDVASRRARQLQSWSGPVPPPPYGSDGVAYSPNGRSVAVSLIEEPNFSVIGVPSAARVLMMDPGTGHVRWQHPYPIRSSQQQEPHVAFTPSGALLTSAQHGDTILWDAATGRMLRRFPIGGLPAISADGREVALGRNSASNSPVTSAWVTVLDLRTGRYRTLAANLGDAWIRGISFIAGGSEIVADAFDGVHVWDVASGALAESDVGQPGQRSVMAIDPGQTTAIVGSQDGSLAGFDLTDVRRLGQELAWNLRLPCTGNTNGFCDAVSPHTDLLADTRSDGTVEIFSLHTLHQVEILPDHNGPDDAVAWLPDGRTVVHGGYDGQVTLWDVKTGRLTHTFRFPKTVQNVAPSPDGRLLAVQTQDTRSTNSQVFVVQIATGHVLQTHTVPDGPSDEIEFSHDGRELVALDCCQPGSTLLAWDTRTGHPLFDRHLVSDAFDISPDSHLLGVGTENGTLLLLDARTGRKAQPPLQVAGGNVASVWFSPDGRTLAVGSADNTVSVWDLRARQRLGNPFGPYPGQIPLAMFEPNGRLLIEPGSADPTANGVQWPIDVGTWERFACRVAGRQLSPAEWHNVLPGRSYERVCPS